jgi:polysaccharide export outer membrane protein
MRFLLPAIVLPLLAACTALPSEGPSTSNIVARATEEAPGYDVIRLDSGIADRVSAHRGAKLGSTFGMGGGAADLRIGVGDVVSITIYEAASGGLFSGEVGSAAKSVNLPPQPVARNGTISVPYVGQVRVLDRTPAEVQATIEAGLANKAIEPQVIVTVSESTSNSVTVAGDVGDPGRVPLSLGGDRLLDVLARAGGAKSPAYDSYVRVTRGDTTVTVSLSRIVEEKGQDIFLRPGDQVFVFTDPRIYTMLGATGQNAAVPFETDRLTLAEAVGRGGGLQDTRADARGVFVFRYEDPSVYAKVRDGAAPPVSQSAGVPVVYQLDLKDPQGYFAAQRFLMRDNDVVYVSNASAVQLQKFLGLIGTGAGIGRTGTSLVGAAERIGD